MRALALCILFCLLPAAATAATLKVQVVGPHGPAADAVVEVTPAGKALAPLSSAGPLVMAQKDLQFRPFVLVVPVHATVQFANNDTVRHHVYSFSPAHKFELKLYGREEARAVRFDKAGVVALGCNIHDSMAAYIRVTEAPFAAKTDRSGTATLTGLPQGLVSIRIWHPYLKGPERVQAMTLGAAPAGLKVTVDLRNPPMRMGAY